MSATVTWEKALKLNPKNAKFHEGRGDLNWVFTYTDENGDKKEIVGGDWKVVSRFGEIENKYVVDPKTGKILFDRPDYAEAPNVNLIVWGRETDGEPKFALLQEGRPHADDPMDLNQTHEKPVTFLQIPMGFMEKIFGKGANQAFEKVIEVTAHEISEETGLSVIRNITRPNYPHHNAGPSFVRTWNELLYVEVDLQQARNPKPEQDELIYKCEFLSIREIMARTRAGRWSDGSVAREARTNGLLWMFLCDHPEMLPDWV